jgi:hypothetical protein
MREGDGGHRPHRGGGPGDARAGALADLLGTGADVVVTRSIGRA